MSKSVAALSDEILSTYGLGADKVYAEGKITPEVSVPTKGNYGPAPDIYADAKALGIKLDYLTEQKEVLTESQKRILRLTESLFTKDTRMRSWIKKNITEVETLFRCLKEMTTTGGIGVNMAGPQLEVKPIPKKKKKTKKFKVKFI